MTEAILRAAFVPFGDVKDVSIPMDNAAGTNRGFGFVHFGLEEDADAAIDNMHNSELFGRVLRVNRAKPSSGGGAGQAVWADPAEWYAKSLKADGFETVAEAAKADKAEYDSLEPLAAAEGGAAGAAAAAAT